MEYHVHGLIVELKGNDEVASVTFTLFAKDEAEAQQHAWSLIDPLLFSMDVTEIEET